MVSTVIPTIFNIPNVSHRILPFTPTTSIEFFNLNDYIPEAGTYPSSNLKSARIPNLDNVHRVAVTISGLQSCGYFNIVGNRNKLKKIKT